MKIWRRVSANYIPDITERYPEGMGGPFEDPDYVEKFNPTRYDTLENIVGDIKAEVKEGEYYNWVRIIKDGEQIFESHNVDDIYREFRNLDRIYVYTYTWYDDKITIRIW